MSDFNETVDAVMNMDPASREMLLEIVLKRQSEMRRKEIAKDGIKAKADYGAGKLKAYTAEEAINRLNTLRQK